MKFGGGGSRGAGPGALADQLLLHAEQLVDGDLDAQVPAGDQDPVADLKGQACPTAKLPNCMPNCPGQGGKLHPVRARPWNLQSNLLKAGSSLLFELVVKKPRVGPAFFVRRIIWRFFFFWGGYLLRKH